jgi:hypothetical protein
MDGTSGPKETTRVTSPVASHTPESNTLSVNVFTAPGKTMVGQRPKPFGEAFGFDPITSTLIFGDGLSILLDRFPGARAPSAIQDTKRYLEDFDRLQKTAKSDQELFDQMTELYPHWVANQSWLMFGFPEA